MAYQIRILVRLSLASNRKTARLLLQILPRAAVRALLAATGSGAPALPAGAATTGAVKRMCCSLEITDVQFGVYDKSQVRTPLEDVVLISPNFSLSDAGEKLCSVIITVILFCNILA